MTIKQAAIDLIVALKGHTLPREAEIACNRLSKAVLESHWNSLTREEIDIAFDDTQEGGGFDDFAYAIESTLRRKNHET